MELRNNWVELYNQISEAKFESNQEYLLDLIKEFVIRFADKTSSYWYPSYKVYFKKLNYPVVKGREVKYISYDELPEDSINSKFFLYVEDNVIFNEKDLDEVDLNNLVNAALYEVEYKKLWRELFDLLLKYGKREKYNEFTDDCVISITDDFSSIKVKELRYNGLHKITFKYCSDDDNLIEQNLSDISNADIMKLLEYLKIYLNK